jgi:hypothetical protein
MNDTINDSSNGINSHRLTDAERISALEITVKEQAKQIAALLKITDIYISPAPSVTSLHPSDEDVLEIDFIKNRAIDATEHGARLRAVENRLDEAWDWVEDLDCRVQHIKPKDLRNSISTKESLDRIVAALLKRQNGSGFITYSQIAALLDITEGRVCQLKEIIKNDDRLTLSFHPTNRRMRIVTLNPTKEV